MIISHEYYDKFKQELGSILFLSILHIWWSFNYSLFVKMNNMLGIFLSSLMTVAGICVVIYAFIFPRQFSFLRDQQLINAVAEEYRATFKLLYITIAAIGAHLGVFIVWYYRIGNMQNMQYAFAYVNCVIFMILVDRAANRHPVPN